MVERITEASNIITNIYETRNLMSIEADEMARFMKKLHWAFLDNRNENTICSPIAIFLILAILAEISDGDIRREILYSLEIDSIDRLRDIVDAECRKSNVWLNTVNQITKTSMWIKEGLKVNYPLLVDLARFMNTDSFSCEMGSVDANMELQRWISENTNGFLNDLTGSFTLKETSVLNILSSVYFSGVFEHEFKNDDIKLLFHGVKGDVLVNSFSSKRRGILYYGNGFYATERSLGEGYINSKIYFILPYDARIPVEDVMVSKDLFEMINKGWNYDNADIGIINTRVPEYEVSSSGRVKNKFAKLGLRKVFDPELCDFRNLNRGILPLYVEDIMQASRIKVNARGVEAASSVYVIPGYGAAPTNKQLEFIIDRPFGYVLVGASGIPVISGVINQL